MTLDQALADLEHWEGICRNQREVRKALKAGRPVWTACGMPVNDAAERADALRSGQRVQECAECCARHRRSSPAWLSKWR